MDCHEEIRKGGVPVLQEWLERDGWFYEHYYSRNGESKEEHLIRAKRSFLKTARYNAAKNGDLAVMEYVDSMELMDELPGWDYENYCAIMIAIARGHLEVVKYLRVEKWCEGSKPRWEASFNCAIIAGQRHIFQYLVRLLGMPNLSLLMGNLRTVVEQGYWRLGQILVGLLKGQGYEFFFPCEKNLCEEVRRARLQQLMLLEKLNIPEDLMRLVDGFLF